MGVYSSFLGGSCFVSGFGGSAAASGTGSPSRVLRALVTLVGVRVRVRVGVRVGVEVGVRVRVRVRVRVSSPRWTKPEIGPDSA